MNAPASDRTRTRLSPLKANQAKMPWFPVHPGDLEGDPEYRLASMAERGALFSLWCLQWSSPDNAVPSDPSKLARLLGVTADEAAAVLPFVLRYFSDDRNGAMEDPRLSALRDHAEETSALRRKAAFARHGRTMDPGEHP